MTWSCSIRGGEAGRAFPALAILLLAAQALAAGATVERFGDGSPSATVQLQGAGGQSFQNITLPAGCRVLMATMRVSSSASSAGGPQYPENVSVLVGGAPVWEFNFTGSGSLGRQDALAGGQERWGSAFPPEGGTNATALRLPAGASVRSATVGLSGGGPRVQSEIAYMTGNILYGVFGKTVSDAGDFNGDGYDDIIAGAPNAGMGPGNMETGYAGLFFGGPSIGTREDVYFKGPVEWGHMGASVSRAGDLNGDGYDDIIVGADEYVTNSIGHTYIFFGGEGVDNIPDVVMAGEANFDMFGISVSEAGDVNGDGHDDVIVGARLHTSQHGYYAGRAHIFFGGPGMDNVSDVVLDGTNTSDFFGNSVAGAGDLNGDGYDDVVVGANGARGVPNQEGYVAVFLGGRDMDSTPDLVIRGREPGDAMGVSVAGAGDLNGDGYDDFLAGAPQNDAGGEDSGAVYVFFGGETLDGQCDLELRENAPYDTFGRAVSGAMDLDNDGHPDVLVGAPNNQSEGMGTGSAYMYLGGPGMDALPDAVYLGPLYGEAFATSVSGAGDVDGDGFNETFFGSPQNCTFGQNVGTASVFGWRTGLRDPVLAVGGAPVWTMKGFFNGTSVSGDFSSWLRSCLSTGTPTGNDAWGNGYIDLSVVAGAAGEGRLTVENISITYEYSAAVADFSVELNDYLAAHREERDASGNLSVPVAVRSGTPGRVRLSDLRIELDDAPALVKPLPDVWMDEDSSTRDLLCLLDYFQDDSTPGAELGFGLSVLTNQSFVRVSLHDGSNITADALTGDGNDNWTGEVELVATAQDARGSVASSNRFRLVVQNVPDPPVITSAPPAAGLAGAPYRYNVTADDGDGDDLAFALPIGPAGMTVDAGGAVRWIPSKMGRHNVSLSVSDGIFSVFQNFSVEVPNSPPRMANSTVPSALTDAPYAHQLEAADDNGDPLVFSLVSGPAGLSLDPSGRIDWVPKEVGQFPVSLAVSDGIATVPFDFQLQVLQGNRAPVFRSEPPASAFAGVPYSYRPEVADPDGDDISFSAGGMPPGMVLDGSTGGLAWTPAGTGLFQVRLRAQDARGLSAVQEFSINVTERLMPSVEFLAPAEGQRVSGRLEASGRCLPGSFGVTGVQVRFDGGPWTDARGLDSWQWTLDTKKLKNGNHTLQARASDGYGWSEPVNRTVLVANAPGGRDDLLAPGAILAAVLAAVAALSFLAFRLRRGRGPAAR